MCTVSVCCAVLVVGFCVVCAVRWCFRVCSCWGFCYLWSVGVSVRLLPSAAPVISSPNKLHKSSHCLPNLTNRFFCALIPSQKSSPAFLSTIICPPFLSLSYSPSLFPSTLFILFGSFALLLLCCPTRPLITPPIGCAPLALRWLCPLPECHLCPRSASASPLHPPRGPVRSRSIDRQKSGMTTSVSADGALDPSMVRTPLDVHVTNPTGLQRIWKSMMLLWSTEVKAFIADRWMVSLFSYPQVAFL